MVKSTNHPAPGPDMQISTLVVEVQTNKNDNDFFTLIAQP